MRTQRLNILPSLGMILAIGVTAKAQYTYTALDFPPVGGGTYAQGIDQTRIVGYYRHQVGPLHAFHGFLCDGTNYITLDAPSVNTYTLPRAISGTNIVGSFLDNGGVTQGFLFNGSTWTTLHDPQAQGGTIPAGISGSDIVGYYSDSNGFSHGFLYNGSTWTTLDNPLAVHDTIAQGVCGSFIVGYYGDTNGTHGFLYDGGNWTTLDHPLAGNLGSHAQGMSGRTIVGYYGDTNGITHGFMFTGSTWTTLDHPLAASFGTFAQGIEGTNVVGYYSDSGGVTHGFLYNGSSYTTLDDPLAGLSLLVNTQARGIDDSNVVGCCVRLSGEVIGSCGGPQPTSGFLYNGSTWTTLDDPLEGNLTSAQGISGTNIVGYCAGNSCVTIWYRGFLYNGSTWTTLDDPLAASSVYGGGTFAQGISGTSIVGYYMDSNGTHGFLATPTAPQLTVITSGSNMVLSWPTNFTGYTLESTVDLTSPTGWVARKLLTPPAIQNGQYVVTIPVTITNTQQFFRLSQ